MKTFSILAALFFSFQLLASPLASASPKVDGTPQVVYDIKADLSIGTKSVSPVEILVKANESALLTQTTGTEQTYIDVLPVAKVMSGKPAVHLKFEVGKISKVGDKTVLAKPQLIVHEGQTVNLELTKENTGTDRMLLKITVTKKTVK